MSLGIDDKIDETESLRRRLCVLESEIDGRRKSEEELRKSEERFRLLVEHARDIVYRYRFFPSPSVEYISPVVFEISGRTPGEFYADPELALAITHPHDRPLLDTYAREGEFGRPLVIRCLHANGSTFWIEHRCLPIYDAAGKLLAIEGIAREVSENRRVLQSLEQHNDRLREEVVRRKRAEDLLRGFSSKTVRYQEEERRRVARELHDGVNQLLCAVGFGLDAASRDLGDRNAAIFHSLEQTRQLLDSSISEIRRISHNLRPGLLDDLGIVPALRSLTEEFENRTGIPICLVLSELDVSLAFEVKTTIYRIAQEALNIVGGTGDDVEIALKLSADDRMIVTEITDGGRGFSGSHYQTASLETEPFESLGERASLVGGSMTVDGTADGSTRLTLQFRVDSAEAEDNE